MNEINFLLPSEPAERYEGGGACNPLRTEVDRRKRAIEKAMLQLEQSVNEEDESTERMRAQGAIPKTTREGPMDEAESRSGENSGIESFSIFSDAAANATENRIFLRHSGGRLED